MVAAKNKGAKEALTPKPLLFGFAAVVVLLFIALVTAIGLTVRNNSETEQVLTDSVKAELIVCSMDAREIISEHIALFNAINSQEDIEAHWDEWIKVVGHLQELNELIHGEYIYALKEIEGVYYFIFDTDPEAIEEHTIFTPYQLSSVHQDAFEGLSSAGIVNVVDEWGIFNTGAVPLFDDHGRQVGIVATDFLNTYVERSRAASSFYTTGLIIIACITMVLLLLIFFLLLRFNAKAQRHLFEMANYDTISGLPNRNYLFGFLKKNIERLKQNKYPFAIIFYDLDNFKTVNDKAGHDAGDALLKKIASFLDAYAKQSPYASANGMNALVARIGGDEFLHLLPGVSTPEEASGYVYSLLRSFRKQAAFQKVIAEFGVGLSVGIALFPSMGTDYDTLVKYADIAMYYAKNAGKNNCRIYVPSMGSNVENAESITRKGPR